MFDLTVPEIFHERKSRKKNEQASQKVAEMPNEDAQKNDATETEVNTRKGYYPDDVANTFGVPVEQHRADTEIQQMDGYIARPDLSEITEPKVIKLHGEGGVPMPLQSVVEGAKLATFIGEAVEYAVSLISQENDTTHLVIEALSAINRRTIVESASFEFLQFIADCYRLVRYFKE